MKRNQILGVGLVATILGVIIMLVGIVGHYHGLAVGGVVVFVIGIALFFFSPLMISSKKNQVKK